MNPAPGLLSDWISLGAYWWLILGCIAVAVLVIFTVNIVQVLREKDEDEAERVVNWCDRNGRRYASAANGWHCMNCGHVVRPIKAPFDQEAS
jgi:hypothetical protein